jgi:hypothetical protein
MNTPSVPPSDEPRASIRLDARLDATTRQKVDDLAKRFHQPRAAVLSHIMHWGLHCGQIIPLDREAPQGSVRHLSCSVASALYQQVQQAAAAVGVKTAPWLRQMIREVTPEAFPASWREGQAEERSHDSRRYGKRFMLRLDDPTWEKLEALSTHFKTSGAEIIRQLLAQATPDTFPASWHIRVVERHREQVRPVPRKADHEE